MTQFANVSFLCVPVHEDTTPENFNILNTKFQLLIRGRYYSLIKSVLDVMAEKIFFKVKL